MEWTLGEGEWHAATELSPNCAGNGKKEEFPGFMENMPPENSFPQICVVSGNKSVGNRAFMVVQFCSYPKNERTRYLSNTPVYFSVNP
jgi:hypothetical protein